jgi:CHAD domain-containing protein
MSAGAAAYVKERLAELDRELEATIPRVRTMSDADAIHDMRVAIRRIRTVLKLSRPVLGRFHADAVRQAFADLQRATGALRDEEVLEETLAEVAQDDRAFAAWRERRKARERTLRRAVLRRLATGELDRARALLGALLLLPSDPAQDKALGKFARKSVGKARKEVESMRDVETDDVDGMHALRIAYKHLRYAAEIFEAALPADIAAMAKPAAHFQKRLGEIHDADVALVAIARARGLPPESRARVLEELRDLRHHRVHKYTRDMAPAEEPPATPEELLKS